METKNQRLLALDILRGLTIILMIVVNDPGSCSEVYAPFLHAEWNGLGRAREIRSSGKVEEKEDGSKLKKGESAEFKIIEFNKEFKRVVASHTAIFKEEEMANVKAAVKKQTAQAAEAKPTLGDANEALQALKDKLDGKK